MTAISFSRISRWGDLSPRGARCRDIQRRWFRNAPSKSYGRNYYYCITQVLSITSLGIPMESIALQWSQGDSDNSHRARDVILAKKQERDRDPRPSRAFRHARCRGKAPTKINVSDRLAIRRVRIEWMKRLRNAWHLALPLCGSNIAYAQRSNHVARSTR